MIKSLVAYPGVSYIYTRVVSQTALELSDSFNIVVEYDEVVPYILNRNGQCPMEKALENVINTQEAFEIIDKFVIQRSKKS